MNRPEKHAYTHAEVVDLLRSEGDELMNLLARAAEIKADRIGNRVWFRGLVEFSNICRKDCLYCGIRKSNDRTNRYDLTDEQIISAVRFAFENRYGSVVLQSGERTDRTFTERIERLVREIKKLSDGRLGITLSLGEQDKEVYARWFAAGAHRYLLRIESTSADFYGSIHPSDGLHTHERRLECLRALQCTGFQTGTGVMIGIPGQTVEELAHDLLFFRDFGIDMVGMGPYIEHEDTPLYDRREELWPLQERFRMTLKMVAVLRILCPDINIAAATALQAIDPMGREKAVKAGANIVMPNITPGTFRNDYALYRNKPCTDEEPEDCLGCLDARLALADHEVAWDDWGDSRFFFSKQ